MFGFGFPGWGWGAGWGAGPGWGWGPGFRGGSLDFLALLAFFALV